MESEVCVITITVNDKSDHYHEEEWVKYIWPMMLPWFTRRHGVNKGKIILEDDGVVVDWVYTSNYGEEDE